MDVLATLHRACTELVERHAREILAVWTGASDSAIVPDPVIVVADTADLTGKRIADTLIAGRSARALASVVVGCVSGEELADQLEPRAPVLSAKIRGVRRRSLLVVAMTQGVCTADYFAADPDTGRLVPARPDAGAPR
jgi:hypothetical protein